MSDISSISINNICYPGGLLPRIIRTTIKKVPLYPELYSDQIDTVGSLPLTSFKIEIPKNASSKIVNMFGELQRFPEVFAYLHGSQADNTQLAFSDYDDLIIIDLKEKSKLYIHRLVHALNKIDLHFCHHDPLQHHGHWIIERQQLENYDESFMPLHVLHEGVRIQGPSQISYYRNKSNSIIGMQRNIKNTIQSIQRLYHLYANDEINLYHGKALISSFALMPAFLIALSCGEWLSKPIAIQKSKELLSPTAYKCVEWATICRNNWASVINTSDYKRFSALVKIIPNPHVIRKFSARFSPKLRLETLPILPPPNVDAFLKESRIYI